MKTLTLKTNKVYNFNNIIIEASVNSVNIYSLYDMETFNTGLPLAINKKFIDFLQNCAIKDLDIQKAFKTFCDKI